MSGFLARKERTSKYEAAVMKLQSLDDDIAGRAYAESAAQKNLKAWIERYNLVRSSGRPCLLRLIGKRCRFDVRNGWSEAHLCMPEGSDHTTMWNRDGKPWAIITQPYGIDFDDLKGMIHICDQYHLHLEIDTWPSWHFPSKVLSLIFRRRAEL